MRPKMPVSMENVIFLKEFIYQCWDPDWGDRPTSTQSLNLLEEKLRIEKLACSLEAFKNEKTTFVLIAGGLGERLGFSNIKISLPVSVMVDDYTYMKYYCSYILACQAYVERSAGKSVAIPLGIMVSNDTNDRTIRLLEDNDYFGLKKS